MGKTTKENKVTPAVKKALNKVIIPVAQVIAAFGGLVILLGLAYQGAQKYLDNMSDDAKSIVAVLIVIGLTYIVAQGLKKIIK